MPRRSKQPNETDTHWSETDKFKRLNKKWLDKLLKDGFKDAEEFDSPLQLMRAHHNDHFRNKFDNESFLDRQRYYELASQLVHSYAFRSKLDKEIWYQHSEGTPERRIAKNCKCPYAYVRKVVKLVKMAIKRDAKDILQDIDQIRKTNE
jgi:hypothetical protein